MQRVFNTLGCDMVRMAKLQSGRYLLSADSPKAVCIAAGGSVELVVKNVVGDLSLEVERGATLRLVRLTTEHDCDSQFDITLHEAAECYATDVILSSADVRLSVKLVGAHSTVDVGGVFLLSGQERGSVTADVAHDTEHTTSRVKYKGVGSGNARGKFSGLVYVAQGAQHTDSEQLSRNVVLGEARIESKPQLEIYADDVRCSHGATVGQLDEQAILYMRQRGLSLQMAQRLQIEGFVSDVVLHSAVEDCQPMLMEVLQNKLQTL